MVGGSSSSEAARTLGPGLRWLGLPVALLTLVTALIVTLEPSTGRDGVARAVYLTAVGLAVLGPALGARAPHGRGSGLLETAIASLPGLAAIGVIAVGTGLGLPATLPCCLALALWGGGAVLVGRATGGAWGARTGAMVGGAVVLGLLSLDGAAALVHGTWGAVIDLLRPGRALRHAAIGVLDLRDGASLAVLPATAALVLRRLALGRAGSTPSRLGNATARAFLVPSVALALVWATGATPLFVDLTPGAQRSITPSERAVVESVRGPLLLEVFLGGPLDRTTRASVRALDDLLAQVKTPAITMAIERRDPTRDPESLRAARSLGIQELPGGGYAALLVRNLERVVVLNPLPAPERQTDALLEAISGARAGAPAAGPQVPALVAGAQAALADDLPDLAVTPLTEAALQESLREASASGGKPKPLVLLLGLVGELSPSLHWLLDQHVMAGGSLGLFSGVATSPLRPLTGPWGLSLGTDVSPGEGTVPASDVFGDLTRLRVPAGVAAAGGPEGLATVAARRGETPVLLLVQGSIPSSRTMDSAPEGAPAPKDMSEGSLRLVVGSTALLSANPELLPRLTDWLLERRSRGVSRGAAQAPPFPAGRLRATTGAAWLLSLGLLHAVSRARRGGA